MDVEAYDRGEEAYVLASIQQAAQVRRIEQALTGGLGECQDCGAGISDLRRSLGARLCLPCQTAQEARARR